MARFQQVYLYKYVMEGKILHSMYLSFSYLLCVDLSEYVYPSRCYTWQCLQHLPHLKRPYRTSIIHHDVIHFILTDTLTLFSNNPPVNPPSARWRHYWITWLCSWLFRWRWCGSPSCPWLASYWESVERLPLWLYSVVHNVNFNSFLEFWNQGYREGGCWLPCTICQWFSQPCNLLNYMRNVILKLINSDSKVNLYIRIWHQCSIKTYLVVCTTASVPLPQNHCYNSFLTPFWCLFLPVHWWVQMLRYWDILNM